MARPTMTAVLLALWRVQRGDVQIALNAQRRRGWGADRRQW